MGAQEGAKVGTGAGLSLSSPNPLLVDPGGLGSSQGSWFSSGLAEAGPGLWVAGGARREKDENGIQGFPSGQGYHRRPGPGGAPHFISRPEPGSSNTQMEKLEFCCCRRADSAAYLSF